jgi:predicted amidophosphoribosyltransferase
MMSETTIEKVACQGCGADVRDESQFCYNCGEAVTAKTKDSHPVVEDEVPDAALAARPPLRSAATLRKQKRAFNRQPLEVSWEQRSDSPVGFVITTIVLVTAAFVLLFLALYLR